MKRILAGAHPVAEALRHAPGDITTVCLADGLRPSEARRIEELASRARVPVETWPRQAIEELAPKLNTQGIIAVTGGYPYVDLDGLIHHSKNFKEPLLVALDQVQDPGNLGAILRSAYAFGARGVILTKHNSTEVTNATVRASAGASELIKVARVTNLVRALDQLKDEGFQVFGAAGEASSAIDLVNWSGPVVLVMGSEGKGLRRLTREHCDGTFAIPMAGGFDSLNVSAASAIALYEASKNRDPSSHED